MEPPGSLCQSRHGIEGAGLHTPQKPFGRIEVQPRVDALQCCRRIGKQLLVANQQPLIRWVEVVGARHDFGTCDPLLGLTFDSPEALTAEEVLPDAERLVQPGPALIGVEHRVDYISSVPQEEQQARARQHRQQEVRSLGTVRFLHDQVTGAKRNVRSKSAEDEPA